MISESGILANIRYISVSDVIMFLLIVGCIVFPDMDIICLGVQALALAFTGAKVIHTRTMQKEDFRYLSWIVVFFIYCISSSIWAANDNTTVLSTSIAFLQFGWISMCVLIYCVDYNHVLNVIDFVIVSAIVLCIRFVVTVPFSQWGAIRTTASNSVFLNNATAMAMAFAAVFIFWKAFVAVDTNRKQKVFSLILAAIIMFAVLMMGTKKGLLIFGIGVIFCYLYKSKNFGSSLLRIVVICIAIGFAYYFLLNNYFLYEVIGKRIELMFGGLTGTATDASTRDRMLYIKDALEVFRQHEVFGVGLDGYRYVNSYSNAYSHNNYSEILADLGIIGFVIYYSMYVKLLSKAIQLLNKNILPLSIIIILMIIDYSSVSYSSELKGIWFALLLAFSKLQHVEEDNAV